MQVRIGEHGGSPVELAAMSAYAPLDSSNQALEKVVMLFSVLYRFPNLAFAKRIKL